MECEENTRKQKEQKNFCSNALPLTLVQPYRCRKNTKQKKTPEKINKNRKDVAVMLCCSPWSNHADVKKHSTQNKQKNTRKQKQKQKICCSNALALTLVQPCRCPILFLSCSQSQCCLSAGEKVSLFVGQWKTKK